MADAKQRAAWDHTALVWSAICNSVEREEGSEPAHPADVHPYRERSDYGEEQAEQVDHEARRMQMLPPELREKILAAKYKRDHGNA